MKLQFYLFFMTFLLTNCLHSSKSQYKVSPLLYREIFVDNKRDSLKIDSLNKKSAEFQENCNRKNQNCTSDPQELYANFLGGIDNFREVVFQKLNSIHSNCGKNKLRITIGNQDNIEKIDILEFTDINTKKKFLKILNSNELNKWESAKLYGIKVKENIEFSIEITGCNKK